MTLCILWTALAVAQPCIQTQHLFAQDGRIDCRQQSEMVNYFFSRGAHGYACAWHNAGIGRSLTMERDRRMIVDSSKRLCSIT